MPDGAFAASMVCFVAWVVVEGITAATAPVSTRSCDWAFIILREFDVDRPGPGLPS